MAISFELPIDLERHLRQELSDLDQVAKEAALVELYRHGKLSHHELATALGLGRLELNGVLKDHGVIEDSITIEEFDEQVASLRKLMNK
jgi:hypothetical protein